MKFYEYPFWFYRRGLSKLYVRRGLQIPNGDLWSLLFHVPQLEENLLEAATWENAYLEAIPPIQGYTREVEAAPEDAEELDNGVFVPKPSRPDTISIEVSFTGDPSDRIKFWKEKLSAWDSGVLEELSRSFPDMPLWACQAIARGSYEVENGTIRITKCT